VADTPAAGPAPAPPVATTFDDQLEAMGFERHGRARTGAVLWVLPINRFLTFTLHDEHAAVLLTWSFDAGEFFLSRGWLLGAGETSFQELHPQRDVRLTTDIEAVKAEMRRVLASLRVDLGAFEL